MDLRTSIHSVYGERPSRPPPGFVPDSIIRGEDEDDDIGSPAVTVLDVGPLSTVRLALHYQNEKGIRSHRVIQYRSIQVRDNDRYLWGFCDLRKKVCCFRIDRILEMVDMRTGEVAENPLTYLAPLIELAKPLKPHKRRKATDGLLAESVNGLVVLLYFAHADGELHPDEREILWHYLDWQRERCSLKGSVAKPAIDALMRTMFPTTDQFAEAVEGLVAAENNHAQFVLDRVPEIIDADGQLHEDEVTRWQQLRELLAEHGVLR